MTQKDRQSFETLLCKIPVDCLCFATFTQSVRLWNIRLPKEWEKSTKRKKKGTNALWVIKMSGDMVANGEEAVDYDGFLDPATTSKYLSGVLLPGALKDAQCIEQIHRNLEILLTEDGGQCEDTDRLLAFLEYIVFRDKFLTTAKKQCVSDLATVRRKAEDASELMKGQLAEIKEILKYAIELSPKYKKEFTQRNANEFHYLPFQEALEISSTFSICNEYTPFAHTINSNNPAAVRSFRDRETVKQELDHLFFGEDESAQYAPADMVFLVGMSGIGKSEAAKSYAMVGKFRYVIYASFDNSARPEENPLSRMMEKYISIPNTEEFSALQKLTALGIICAENRADKVLFVIDNLNRQPEEFSDADWDCWEALQRILCKKLITSNVQWMEQYVLTITSMEEKYLLDLFNQYAPIYESEKEQAAVRALITEMQGHTLAVELIAKMLYAERCHNLSPSLALERLREQGITSISDKKLRTTNKAEKLSVKELLSRLFRITDFTDEERGVLYCTLLLPDVGIEQKLFNTLLGSQHDEAVEKVVEKGWLTMPQAVSEPVALHPLIAEVIAAEVMKCPEQHDAIFGDFFEKICSMLKSGDTSWAEKGENIDALMDLGIGISDRIVKYDIRCQKAYEAIREAKNFIALHGKIFWKREWYERYLISMKYGLPSARCQETEAMYHYHQAMFYFGESMYSNGEPNDYGHDSPDDLTKLILADWFFPMLDAFEKGQEHYQKFKEISANLEDTLPLSKDVIAKIDSIGQSKFDDFMQKKCALIERAQADLTNKYVIGTDGKKYPVTKEMLDAVLCWRRGRSKAFSQMTTEEYCTAEQQFIAAYDLVQSDWEIGALSCIELPILDEYAMFYYSRGRIDDSVIVFRQYLRRLMDLEPENVMAIGKTYVLVGMLQLMAHQLNAAISLIRAPKYLDVACPPVPVYEMDAEKYFWPFLREERMACFYTYAEVDYAEAKSCYDRAVQYPIKVLGTLTLLFGSLWKDRNKPIKTLIDEWDERFPQLLLEDEEKARTLDIYLKKLGQPQEDHPEYQMNRSELFYNGAFRDSKIKFPLPATPLYFGGGEVVETHI